MPNNLQTTSADPTGEEIGKLIGDVIMPSFAKIADIKVLLEGTDDVMEYTFSRHPSGGFALYSVTFGKKGAQPNESNV